MSCGSWHMEGLTPIWEGQDWPKPLPGFPQFTGAILLQHVMTIGCAAFLTLLVLPREHVLQLQLERALPLTEPAYIPAGPDQGLGLQCSELALVGGMCVCGVISCFLK